VSVLGAARSMAAGTVASRATGFLRTAVLTAVLGVQGVGAAYNVANTAPNIVYELLLGGVLTSVVVPMLVRAAQDGDDEGAAFAQRLLTVVALGLGAVAVLLVVLAPQLVSLYSAGLSEEDRELAVVLARFFLPQVLFYGCGAVLGAVLNTRGRFAPPMWAPVLNNVVVIATGLLVLLLPGTSPLTAGSITETQVVVLGVGTTLGIVAQTVALLPSLRAAGFRLRPRFDLRGSGLSRVVPLGSWVLLYVALNQAAYVVVVRLSTADELVSDGRGYPSYLAAFVLWQLPHAVVAVSITTALLPAMSRAAAADRLDDLRSQLDHGLRLTVAVLVPASVAYLVLGRHLAVVVFAHGQTSVEEARYIGTVLAVFATGLTAFSTYQLQLRAFYAQQDTRTPTLVNLAVNATLVVADVALYVALPDRLEVAGLAAGQALSFAVGLAVCTRVLARRVPRSPDAHVVRTAVRCVVASAPAALVAALLARGASALVARAGDGPGPLASLAALALAGPVLVLGYAAAARRVRVPEVDEVAGPVLGRLLPGGRRPTTGG
jgi:putative peptidoglycan lipid II flippase